MSGERFVLAIDQGTTSTRAIVFDREGGVRASAQAPLTQIYPAPGQVEHDPDEIWRSVLHVGRTAFGRTAAPPGFATSSCARGGAIMSPKPRVW
jgi:glycerol kinase